MVNESIFKASPEDNETITYLETKFNPLLAEDLQSIWQRVAGFNRGRKGFRGTLIFFRIQ